MNTLHKLTGYISHEMRNPLNGIEGILHLLEETELTERQRILLSRIRFSSSLLLRLTDDISNYFENSSDDLKLNLQPMGLQKLFEYIEDMFTPQAEAKGLRFKSRSSFPEDFAISADYIRLTQVLGNLIHNSIKHTEAGSITISAEITERFSDDKNLTELLFCVEDTGSGIPPDCLDYIFDEYVQLDRESSPSYSYGLGLYLCKKLVTSMGGEIWAESMPNKGSRFFFTIKAEVVGMTGDGAPYSSKTASPHLTFMRVLRLLIVDDCPLNYEILESILSPYNISCDYAPSGEDCISYISTLPPHYYNLILMDVNMPILDGFETALRLKLMGLAAPIVAMSANVPSKEEQAQYSHLFEEYLEKPLPYNDLIFRITSYLERPCLDEPLNIADSDTAIEYMGGDKDIYRRHFEKFKSQGEKFAIEIRDLLKSGRLEEGRIAIHSLKGLSVILGLPSIATLTEAMENSLDMPHALEAYAKALIALLEELRSLT